MESALKITDPLQIRQLTAAKISNDSSQPAAGLFRLLISIVYVEEMFQWECLRVTTGSDCKNRIKLIMLVERNNIKPAKLFLNVLDPSS